MLKKHAPLLLIALSLVSIKLSSETYNVDQNPEPKVLELSGLKIITPKRSPAFVPETALPEIIQVLAKEEKPKVACTELTDFKKYKETFTAKNLEALRKILGPWYFDTPEKLEYEYSFFETMTSTALYSSGLHAAKRTIDASDKNNLNRYASSNMFYKLYYKDRTNSDTLFYIYSFYKKMKVDASALNYLKEYLKEATKHESLSLEINKKIIKLSKDPESLAGAFEFLKEFRGLSAGSYLTTLRELTKESRVELAKLMIKTGDDKNITNPYIEWSPDVYTAAYTILKEEEMDRPYNNLKDLKELKAESNTSFVNRLTSAKTNCDLEEIWSIAGPVIREL